MALMDRSLTVSSIGLQDTTYEDSLAHLPGRVPVPAPGIYAAFPGRKSSKIVRLRYEFRTSSGSMLEAM
eukprot:3666946-Alexandrium_andersonii.AAC.1